MNKKASEMVGNALKRIKNAQTRSKTLRTIKNTQKRSKQPKTVKTALQKQRLLVSDINVINPERKNIRGSHKSRQT